MSERGHEFSAKSVEEAIEEGLRTLRLSRDEVIVEVINRGSRGILGFGSEPAVVRLTPESEASAPTLADVEAAAATPTMADEAGDDSAPAPAAEAAIFQAGVPARDSASPADADAESVATVALDMQDGVDEDDELESDSGLDASLDDDVDDEEVSDEDAGDEDASDEELEALAVDLLAELLELMGFEAEIVTSWEAALEEDGAPSLNLDIRGEELGVLIGRRGETLANIQFLLRLMVNQRLKSWKNIVVDVEQYKERRGTQLTQLANRMAEQVATSGRPVSLEPMPANERRIIHIALRDHPAVYTESTGEGDRRKITILPR